MEPENQKLVSEFRIRSVPYVQLYKGSEVVDQIKASPTIVSDITAKLQHYLGPFVVVEDEPENSKRGNNDDTVEQFLSSRFKNKFM
eukprot:CAMPEP_0117744904 /NCGR_PEP_ID=MMETSP0947-20121206/7039_1 /TAXON_ID=44440 /ORGANISM="Chattonella subsalsa, Strain CCMP2191" /LENGTH=85 /DNA_ID=CAMNT_0005561947 /DNA_START=659 /DNA_END=916 /DNA_ORIENTATION=-